ncbi:SDR family oxidoreductase [Nocardioides sp.]|uniref:SDR family oxidoreductase n=1 Tax=Nocardioides sp. TaxID=35761 RepID=UPI002CAE91F0|nr:NAD(P)H-binding protein [Nocardioides sp.]HVX53200.1 NAD(P)H-binding protein [Nocardioides sp.]
MESTRRLAVAGATGLIGSQVVRIARAAGHEVVALSRSGGVDLTEPDSIGDRLDGVDAVIDVTRSPAMDEQEAVDFFTTVAANLGAEARAAGVARTVVLSIVGVDRSQDYGWYVATLAHERATRQHAPGARVLRATQFHEFPGQVLERSRQGDRALIMDMPTQPVASVEVARMLVELATDDGDGDVDLAGPRRESLVDLVRRLVGLRGEDVAVEAVPAAASMASGSVLPGPDAVIRGVDWDTWAREAVAPAARPRDDEER